MEGTAVVVFDDQTGEIAEHLPPVGSGLRWDEFIARMRDRYLLRFVEG